MWNVHTVANGNSIESVHAVREVTKFRQTSLDYSLANGSVLAIQSKAFERQVPAPVHHKPS